MTFRRENSWEPPKTAVSSEVARLGFTDCWASVGRPGLTGTCRSVDATAEISICIRCIRFSLQIGFIKTL